MILDQPATQPVAVDTGISRRMKQSFDEILSHAHSPSPKITRRSNISSVTPPNSPRQSTAQSFDFTAFQSSETPTPFTRESTDMATTASLPPNTLHEFSLYQTQHSPPSSSQDSIQYEQPELDDRPPLPWCQLSKNQWPINKDSILFRPPTFYYILAPMNGYVAEVSPHITRRRFVQVSKNVNIFYSCNNTRIYFESIVMTTLSL